MIPRFNPPTGPKCILCYKRFPIHKLRKLGKWGVCAGCDRAVNIAGSRDAVNMGRVRKGMRRERVGP